MYVLVSYLPVPDHINEMKTKPTQHAVKLLSGHGMVPDFIICRATRPIDEVRKRKIEVSANIPKDRIISAPDLDIVYQVPIHYESEQVGVKMLAHLGLKPKKEPDWTRWTQLVQKIRQPSQTVKVAMVGKYVEIGDYEFTDSYISVNQSLEHAGANLDTRIDISWIDSSSLEMGGAKMCLENLMALLCRVPLVKEGLKG